MIAMANLPIHCPVCQSAIVATVADTPAIKLYQCQRCKTSFTVVPAKDDEPST